MEKIRFTEPTTKTTTVPFSFHLGSPLKFMRFIGCVGATFGRRQLSKTLGEKPKNHGKTSDFHRHGPAICDLKRVFAGNFLMGKVISDVGKKRHMFHLSPPKKYMEKCPNRYLYYYCIIFFHSLVYFYVYFLSIQMFWP